MNTPSLRDVERLSAYLDGQLPAIETARLQARLGSDPELAAALEDLSQARAALRRLPQRRAPRNFTLTPRMAGLRPPLPRAVPALSWASAAAMLLFVCNLGSGLLGRLSWGAAAPMMAAEPRDQGGGGGPEYGIGGGPPATELPVSADALSPTPTPGPLATAAASSSTPDPSNGLLYLESTPEPSERTADQPASPKDGVLARIPWLAVWPSLAAALLAAAAVVRWRSRRAFRKRLRQ